MSFAGVASRLVLASQSPNNYGARIVNVGDGAVIVQNTVPSYTYCHPQKNFAAYGRLAPSNPCVPNSFWMSDEQKVAPPQYVMGKTGYYADAYGNAYTS